MLLQSAASGVEVFAQTTSSFVPLTRWSSTTLAQMTRCAPPMGSVVPHVHPAIHHIALVLLGHGAFRKLVVVEGRAAPHELEPPRKGKAEGDVPGPDP